MKPGITAVATVIVGLTLCLAPAAAQETSQQLRAKGKVLYEKTAGGIGCAYCHGIDARGKAEVASPPVRGAGQDLIYGALETRAQMRFLHDKINDDEVRAIAEYLRSMEMKP